MYSSIIIHNFRCFENLELSDLGKYNFIIGRNNIGKTTLIEAIRLLDEASSSAYTIRAGAYYAEYFNDEKSPIVIYGESPNFGSRKIVLNFLPFGKTPKFGFAVPPGSLEILYTDEDGAEFPTYLKPPQPRASGNQVQQQLPEDDPNFEPKVRRYISQLNASGMVKALRLIEPRLSNLTIEQVRGKPLVYGILRTGKKVPLPSMGDGINHLLMTLAILFDKNTQCSICSHEEENHSQRCYVNSCSCSNYSPTETNTILWDEIEHSYYPGFLNDLWKIILDSELNRERQFFITTHDHSFLKKLSDSKGEYRVIKLFRDINDDNVSVEIEGAK